MNKSFHVLFSELSELISSFAAELATTDITPLEFWSGIILLEDELVQPLLNQLRARDYSMEKCKNILIGWTEYILAN